MDKIVNKSRSVRNTLSVTKQDIMTFIISLLSFFLGRVVIFQSLSPVAVAFLSNFNFMGTKFYLIAFFIILGFITKSSSIYLSKYIICILLMSVINLVLGKDSKKPNVIVQSAVGSISILISGLIIALLNSFSVYYTFIAILEAILTFSLSYVFKKGTSLFYFSSENKIVNNEEILSLAIFIGSVIAGSADVYIGNISLMYFFLSLSLMIISYKCGMSVGCASSVLLGILLYISNFCKIDMIIILALSSILSGSLKSFNKLFPAVGFVIGLCASAYFINFNLFNMELLFSAVGAGIIFLIIPNKFYISINSTLNVGLNNTEAYITKIKEITNIKLKDFSNAFIRLSKTFNGISEKKTSLDQKDVSKLIDDVAANVCNKCSMKGFCWENNFYNTYQTVFSILAACEKKGSLDIDDIPDDFKNNCSNVALFAETTNRMFDIYKNNLVWRNRIVESRELVSQQLYSVADIINNLASEIDFELNFKDDISNRIIDEFIKNNIYVNSVVVMQNKNKKFEVVIMHDCCFGKKACTKDIIPIINHILNRKMCKVNYDCIVTKKGHENICKLKLVEEQKFRVTTAVSKAMKTNSRESGDSYTYMDLSNGSYLLALSDGMGSGIKAREESAASIELFEDFMYAGFDKDMAINMINSVLVLKSNEDCFSTLDICTIDLYTGICEFVKIGAASTFIVYNERVDVIKSSSLPVGILNKVDVETNKRKLKDSAMIVMITDGVSDSNENITIKENWIIDLLMDYKSSNPQDIADYLLSCAKENSKGIIKDDMTVLVAKIWTQ